MPVAETTFPASEKLDLFAVFSNFAKEITTVGIKDRGADGHFNYLVFTILARGAVFTAALTVCGEDVTTIAQRKQCPHMTVALKDDVTSATAVASVRTTFRYIFRSMEMARACASLAAAAKDFYVIYEV